MKKLLAALFGKERTNHQGNKFKSGSRPAIILEMLCEGDALSGWSGCQRLRTHNADRDLRHVRRCLRNAGVGLMTFTYVGENKRQYKITTLAPANREAARKLIVGKVA